MSTPTQPSPGAMSAAREICNHFADHIEAHGFASIPGPTAIAPILDRAFARPDVDELVKALEDLRADPAVLGTGGYDQGLMCGVEDRGLQGNGYEAMRYGYDCALERVFEALGPIITALQAATVTRHAALTKKARGA